MSTIVQEDFAEVWERAIQPEKADLSPEAAQYFLKVGFADVDRQRMDALAAKARTNSLTEKEQLELNNFMQLGWFLDLMKSKARRSLGVKPKSVN